MLDWALKYAAAGWRIIPVGPDKNPLIGPWKEFQERPATEEEIRFWWTRWPNAGIAVLTGRPSGVIVLDADDETGRAAVEACLTGPTLAATTGGGGKHFYFIWPGVRIQNAVRIMPGLDVRGDGGYVVAPPSVHKSGRRYEWDNPSIPPAELPPDLLSVLAGKPGARRLTAADWEAAIPEGRRDEELTRRAGRLLGAGLNAAEALAILRAVNAALCRPPLPDQQVRKIVDSIAARETAAATAPGGNAAETPFTILTQAEMVRRFGDDSQPWTIDEWLPESSCGLLVAPPGNFKTWILMAATYSVATGRPFLGKWTVHQPGPVLVIQQEDPWWMLQNRLARMIPQEPPTHTAGPNPEFTLDCRFVGELENMPVFWYTDRQLHFNNRAAMAALERAVRELKPRLVIIDPLYTAADTKDYMAEGAQRMATLKTIRDRYGTSFIVAHHTTVAGATSEDRTAIWGSQFLNAWLEFGWRMPQGDGHGNTIIRHFKGSADPKRIRLRFEIDDWSFHAEAAEEEPTPEERVEELISAGQYSIREIARAAGVGHSTVYRILKQLKQEGR